MSFVTKDFLFAKFFRKNVLTWKVAKNPFFVKKRNKSPFLKNLNFRTQTPKNWVDGKLFNTHNVLLTFPKKETKKLYFYAFGKKLEKSSTFSIFLPFEYYWGWAHEHISLRKKWKVGEKGQNFCSTFFALFKLTNNSRGQLQQWDFPHCMFCRNSKTTIYRVLRPFLFMLAFTKVH